MAAWIVASLQPQRIPLAGQAQPNLIILPLDWRVTPNRESNHAVLARYRRQINTPIIFSCKGAPANVELVGAIEVTSMTSHDADLHTVAQAYIEQREAGALDYPAFLAAVGAYRKHHPEATKGEAAFIVNNLMQEMPRAGYQ